MAEYADLPPRRTPRTHVARTGDCLARPVRAYRRPGTSYRMTEMTDIDSREFTRGMNGRLGFELVEWREGYARVTVDLDERHETARRHSRRCHRGPDRRRHRLLRHLRSRPGEAARQRHAVTERELHGPAEGRPADLRRGGAPRRPALLLRLGPGARRHRRLIASGEAVYAYVDRDAQRRPTPSDLKPASVVGQGFRTKQFREIQWIPACAGMTVLACLPSFPRRRESIRR